MASSECLIVNISQHALPTGSVKALVEKHEAALLMLLGFSVFAVMLAGLYNAIRHHIFHDADNLDTTFDAGGNVSMSLTAVTIASQLLWPADMLQSATVAVKYGVSGAFWYSIAAAFNINLFPLLSLQFKTRAPGAKTYLQVIQARFGRVTHTIFCAFALLINVHILIAIIVVGIALTQNLVVDASPEFCVLIIATLCGSYSFVGGLGSTFYVSYFNAVVVFALLFVLIVNIFYQDHPDHPLVGDLDAIYSKIACLQAPSGNEEGSYLTFWSAGGIIWAVVGICLTASITFCDQASWQSRIAAKPVQGVWGFLLATFVWFAIPSTIGTTVGLSYLALSADNASLALTEDDINAGLVTAYVAQLVMGKAGAFLVLTMFTMLVMSTGSGEIMAVSSIVVYDIYNIYINPFRKNQSRSQCILCGAFKSAEVLNPTPATAFSSTTTLTTTYNSISDISDSGNSNIRKRNTRDEGDDRLCKCPRVSQCLECKNDALSNNDKTKETTSSIKRYSCRYHGEYRQYQETLISFKNWCILWVTVGLVPFGLLVHVAQLDLNWVMMTGAIVVIPCFPGVVLSLLWVKVTAAGMCVGSISGLVCGLTANLLYASQLPGGLSAFIHNTAHNYAVLAGCLTSVITSVILTCLVSLFTHNIRTTDDEQQVWDRLRQIGNPLHPWSESYQKEFPELNQGGSYELKDRTKTGSRLSSESESEEPRPASNFEPSYEDLSRVFAPAKITSIVGSVCVVALLVLLVPGVMAALHVLDVSEFRGWFTTLQVWCAAMGILVLVITPAEELRSICKRLIYNRRMKAVDSTRL